MAATAGWWTGRRRTAAAAASAAALLASLLLARTGPAAPPGRCDITVSRGTAQDLSGSAAATLKLCLSGSLTGALLDVRVQPNDAKSDSVELELRSDSGSYLRSSRIGTAGVWQRVALANPTASGYQINVNPAGPAGGLLSAVDFHGTVSLGAIPATPASSFKPPVVLPGSGDGEPTVVVDRGNVNPERRDTVFVTAPVGTPSVFNPIATGNGSGGIDYWRCDAHKQDCSAGSKSFDYRNISLPDGGGDSHVAVDGVGGVYFADLAATTNLNLLKSTNEGKTVGQLPPTGNTTADREWLAPYLADKDRAKGTGAATLHLAYHDLPTQELWECNGSNGGAFPEPCVPIVPRNDPSIPFTAATNTIIGPQVVNPKTGTIYLIFGTSTPSENAATGGNGAIDRLYLGVSPDGFSWKSHPIVKLAEGTSATNIFPVIALDSAGTIYAAWSEQSAGPAGSPRPIRLTLSHSLDKDGTKWSTPAVVNAGGINSAVLPWITAAAPGQVDLVYVGSTTDRNPDDALANWYVYMARSTNANTDRSPTFSTVAVAPNPVRYGQVCVSGILCATQGDEGRSLLDFISVDLDSRGCAFVAIPSAANQATYPPPSTTDLVTQTLVAKQSAGCFSTPVAVASLKARAPAQPNKRPPPKKRSPPPRSKKRRHR